MADEIQMNVILNGLAGKGGDEDDEEREKTEGDAICTHGTDKTYRRQPIEEEHRMNAAVEEGV